MCVAAYECICASRRMCATGVNSQSAGSDDKEKLTYVAGRNHRKKGEKERKREGEKERRREGERGKPNGKGTAGTTVRVHFLALPRHSHKYTFSLGHDLTLFLPFCLSSLTVLTYFFAPLPAAFASRYNASTYDDTYVFTPVTPPVPLLFTPVTPPVLVLFRPVTPPVPL